MSRTFFQGLLALSILLCAVSAQAQQRFTADQKQSLQGITAFLLIVEFEESTVEIDGLNRAELEIEVAQRLRRAGIRLMNEVEWSRQPGVPFLYVYLNTVRSELGFYSYRAEVRFKQEVSPVRNTSISSIATTWETGSLGFIGVNRVETLKPEVLSLIDEFLIDYRQINRPGQPR
ncbi:MAG: hypothetical protein LAT75_06775 [Candidatus Cyclonatronum sp.]|uniref:hypothetical protein n=1 Tax=Cyclonatronum sp. TaxID=3024185 RepID=UPI0025BD77BA|nr:hypothetical protein [Cyclonatronum sp.]MCC5934523.1 hypothetical protein [Balneolales bacterium]MCH8486552.1 hypothetical protein [Cyclonatronum sp.]